MLSSSLDALSKLSKTSSPPKLFDYDCVTLYFPRTKYLSPVDREKYIITSTGPNHTSLRGIE